MGEKIDISEKIAIEKINAYCIKIPLTEVFKISQNSRPFHQSVIIEVKTKNGITGFGEAVPSKYVMNETIEQTYEFAQKYLSSLYGMDALNRNLVTEKLLAMHSPFAIITAMNSALTDILGKFLNVPACKILGGNCSPIETSATISIGIASESVKSAEKLLNKGFRALKIKVGLSVKTDIARVRAIRKLDKTVHIYTDANQGYTANEAIEFANSLTPFEVSFIEQPVKADDILSLKKVKENSPVPIMADESVKSPFDAFNVATSDAVNYINIKLTKAGGIDNALKIAHISESAHIKNMLGCMLGSNILLSASFTTFNASSNFAFADLDGFLTFSKLPAEGGVYLKNGKLHSYGGTGLGIEKLNLKGIIC